MLVPGVGKKIQLLINDWKKEEVEQPDVVCVIDIETMLQL